MKPTPGSPPNSKDSKLTDLLDQILLYGQTPVQLLQARRPKRVPESCKRETEKPADLLVQVTNFPLKPVAAFLLKSGVLIVTEDNQHSQALPLS